MRLDQRLVDAAIELAESRWPTGESGAAAMYTESSSGWNDLIGWIEEQGEEDTQGFAVKCR